MVNSGGTALEYGTAPPGGALSAVPATPSLGDLYNDTTNGKLLQATTTTPYTWKSIIDNTLEVINDDFTYASQGAADAAWVPNDSAKNRVNVTNDNLAFDIVQDNTNDNIAFDLGASIVSDTAWVLRFSFNLTTITQGADNYFWFGISSTPQSTDTETATDFLGVQIDTRTASERYGSIDTDGVKINGTTPDNTAAMSWATSTDYFMEIVRQSATAFIVRRYSSAAYTTVSDSAAGTCAATTASLRYITLANSKQTATGQLVGTIDNVRFWNRITAGP